MLDMSKVEPVGDGVVFDEGLSWWEKDDDGKPTRATLFFGDNDRPTIQKYVFDRCLSKGITVIERIYRVTVGDKNLWCRSDVTRRAVGLTFHPEVGEEVTVFAVPTETGYKVHGMKPKENEK